MKNRNELEIYNNLKKMGIKDLRTFLKSKEVKCFHSVPLTLFSEKRIGIDSLNWVFCYIGSCVKSIITYRKDILQPIEQDEIYEKLLKEFINFNNKLLDYNITPVWIWDGVSKDNKKETKEARQEARKKITDKKDTIRETLKKLNPLEQPYELINEYKKLLVNSSTLKRSKIEQLKEFSLEVGLPTITARTEGENLGASLGAARILAALWSADTDTYPLGCPVVVKGFENINGRLHFNAVFTPFILKDLKLNHEEFRDFCIMLGTDFNTRIYKVGPVKSFDLITKYRCIENIEKLTKGEMRKKKTNDEKKEDDDEPYLDCSCLKYKEIRTQFCSYTTKYNGTQDLQVKKDKDFEEIRQKYEKISNIEPFLNAIKYLKTPQNVPKLN